MADWFQQAFVEGPRLDWTELVARLGASFVLGVAVAGIYKATRLPANIAVSFPGTLVLLSVLIAMVTQVIGENVARAFSLVGALSIVRFRTVVQDTKDTAFVIFAVVVGMAIGAGQPLVAVCGFATVAVAAAAFRDMAPKLPTAARDVLLIVRFGWSPNAEASIASALAKHASETEVISAATVRKGAAVELHFRVRLLPNAVLTQVIADLNRIEGLQSAELRQTHDHAAAG